MAIESVGGSLVSKIAELLAEPVKKQFLGEEGKKFQKETETLRKLEEEGKKFQKVAHKVPLQDIEFLPSKELTPSESSKEAFEQIMKALKDDNINMIGLYGMGGVGKTTLVKEVGRRARETQLIDEVLLATMSQNPNVKNIQDRMAESLGLQFDVKTKEGRADRLWQRLKTEKKLLVILDDVWQDVNLKEIGIPFGDDNRGCKVLLTTRLGGICFHMQCQQQVLLSILSENEAWALFKINAGLRDEDSNLNTVEIEDRESLEELFELGEAGEGINEEKELWLLSSLTRLELKLLPELKCIWKGPTRHVSLRSLVHLELQFHDKLTFIFTLSLAQSLDHLETLRIDDCSGLKHLIGEEKDDEREIIPKSLGFPKLKTLSISGCDQLEYVFPVSVSPSLLNLEEMEIAFGPRNFTA